VFYAEVVKVDQNVAHAVMIVHLCCKFLFPTFHLFFHTYVASMFIWMLHMFHTYVVNVLSRCCICFTMVFKCFSNASDAYFKCFICIQTYVTSAAS
jgi:hypothetical protein